MQDLNDETGDIIAPGTYQIKKYDIAFDYPASFVIHNWRDTFILLKEKEAAQYDWFLEIHLELNKFLPEMVLGHCAADGPGGSTFCDKIISQKPFAAKSGIKGYEMYINEVYQTMNTN